MMKFTNKKLKLAKDTLRALDLQQMTQVYGGTVYEPVIPPAGPGSLVGCDLC